MAMPPMQQIRYGEERGIKEEMGMKKYKNPLTFVSESKQLWFDGCEKDYKKNIVYCGWLHNGHLFCPYGCEEVEEE